MLSDKYPVPSTTAWSWRSPVGPLTTIPIVFVFIVGLIAPTDILDKNSFAKWLVNLVRGGLMSIVSAADINNFASSTDYPQVALLSAALHWLLLPIQILIMIFLTEICINVDRWRFWKATRGNRVDLNELKLSLGVPLFFFCLIVATMVPGDWSLANGWTTRNRLGMSCGFLVVFWIFSISVVGVYGFLRAFIDLNIRGK